MHPHIYTHLPLQYILCQSSLNQRNKEKEKDGFNTDINGAKDGGVSAADAASSVPTGSAECRSSSSSSSSRNNFRAHRFAGMPRQVSGEPKPFLGTNVEAIDISLFPAEVRMLKYIAYECFDSTGSNVVDSFPANITTVMPYRFSNKRNKFTAIGCHTLAYIVGLNGQQFASGCTSFCDSLTSPTNGSCSGIGCCQTDIPKDVAYFEMQWGFDTNPAANITRCSYAVLVEEDSYNFSTTDLLSFVDRNQNGVPVVLDWAAGDLPCQAAKGSPNYACRSKNSYCYDSAIGTSYLCNCSEGYEGNPYLDGGCADIDECNRGDQYPCHGTCTNLPGSYNCTCPKGTQGNPVYQNCTGIPDKFPLKEKLAVGACVGATIALALCFITIIELQKRRHIRDKAAYFKQNGGQILHEEMTLKESRHRPHIYRR
uniref:EGF-like domain-containing protein n=1 Tax=Ananas comosus var. bracteatus TaxID=296719 RepID=A0A6V7NQV2_ANACO|nr:unnamed protein product [Ananas comosus var. bracteatus]